MAEKDITDEDFYRQFANLYSDLTISGKAPWMNTGKIERGVAYNPSSGVIFKGINSLILEMSAAQQGFKDSRWISMAEAERLGYKPKHRSRPTPIAYVNKYAHPVDVHPSTGKAFDKENPRQKYYFMYNVEQLQNCELTHGRGFIISKGLIDEKIRNAIQNSKAKSFPQMQAKLFEEATKTVPVKTEMLAATIAGYRLAQEFNAPYRPAVCVEDIKKVTVNRENLLRCMYQSEIAKDRLLSKG